MLLTSSHTNPTATVDRFSDYDVIFIVTNIKPLLESEDWLENFGKVLTVYRDPVRLEYGFERFIHVTQYEDGCKIDFTVWPVELLQRIVNLEKLPGHVMHPVRVGQGDKV